MEGAGVRPGVRGPQVVDAWQIDSWDAYRDIARLGRRTRLPETRRKSLWAIFERVRGSLNAANEITEAGMYGVVAAACAGNPKVVYDHVVADEAQDINIAQLKFLAALAGGRANGLFFTGDLGQRIFQQPYSWRSLGIDVRGRSETLRVNYRTSHQIRARADRLLGPVVTDADGIAVDRRHTISVVNGPAPTLGTYATVQEEAKAVGRWISERLAEGVLPHETAVFVRSEAQVPRAVEAAQAAGVPHRVLDEKVLIASGSASLCTMQLAKGLEFRAVVVMACDDEVLPLQERIEAVGDEGDLQEAYESERHLLYVACTRAREHLLVTCVDPGSEFLDDLAERSG